jgi:hypothetical protein
MKYSTVIPILLLALELCRPVTGLSADKKTAPQGRTTVQVVSPRPGEQVHGPLRIEARVNDPGKVRYVEFYIQEPGAKDRYSWKDFSPPFVWGGDNQTLDTTLFDDGQASAVAFVFDQGGTVPVAQERVQFVIDNGKPKVRILSPREQDKIQGVIKVRVEAADPKGIRKAAGIKAVSFFLDGSLVGTSSHAPYEADIQTCLMSSGLHSLRVVAEDLEGMIGADTAVFNVDEGSTAVGPVPSGR